MEKTQENTTFVISENPKANSFEVGKSGHRFKIYYSDVRDLEIQLKELAKAELITEEEYKNKKE